MLTNYTPHYGHFNCSLLIAQVSKTYEEVLANDRVQVRIQRAEVMVGMVWIFRCCPQSWIDHCFPNCLHVLTETKAEAVDKEAETQKKLEMHTTLLQQLRDKGLRGSDKPDDAEIDVAGVDGQDNDCSTDGKRRADELGSSEANRKVNKAAKETTKLPDVHTTMRSTNQEPSIPAQGSHSSNEPGVAGTERVEADNQQDDGGKMSMDDLEPDRKDKEAAAKAAIVVRLAAEEQAAEMAMLIREMKKAAEVDRKVKAAAAKAAEVAWLAAVEQAAEMATLIGEMKATAEADRKVKKAAESARLAAEKQAAEMATLIDKVKAAEQARLASEQRAIETAKQLAEMQAAAEAQRAAESLSPGEFHRRLLHHVATHVDLPPLSTANNNLASQRWPELALADTNTRSAFGAQAETFC